MPGFAVFLSIVSMGARLREEGGASLVEIAVSISLLLSILFGIVEFSLALYAFHYVSDAAREGCRYAIVRGSECTGFADCGIDGPGIQTYVRGLGYPFIDAANQMTVSTTWYTASWNTGTTPPTTTWAICGKGTLPTGCNLPGNQVEVKVTYNFALNIPWWQFTIVPLSSTARMVISQ